jgi:hypothetical protein
MVITHHHPLHLVDMPKKVHMAELTMGICNPHLLLLLLVDMGKP